MRVPPGNMSYNRSYHIGNKYASKFLGVHTAAVYCVFKTISAEKCPSCTVATTRPRTTVGLHPHKHDGFCDLHWQDTGRLLRVSPYPTSTPPRSAPARLRGVGVVIHCPSCVRNAYHTLAMQLGLTVYSLSRSEKGVG